MPVAPRDPLPAADRATIRPGARLCHALLVLVAGGCVAAYAGQLFLGRWQTDEYRLFGVERSWGWHALAPRLAYSPRPFSELILFLYGQAVIASHRPLITTFLGLLWAAVIVAASLAAREALPPSPGRTLVAVGLVLSTFAFVLVTNDVTELFFWPMATAAYLPAACAATALLFLMAAPSGRVIRLARAGALLVAASSCEMGAALALGFAIGAAVEHARARRWPSGADAWWLLPAAAAVAVFAVLLSVRVGMNELGADTHSSTGHPVISLVSAARQLAIELAGTPIGQGEAAMPAALAARLLFALGLAACFQQAGGRLSLRDQLPLAAALAIACFFSLFAAYLHYGTACCERQATTRAWFLDLLFVLALAPAARAITIRSGPTLRAILPALMLIAALSPVLSRGAAFDEDLASRGLALQSRSRTWSSGLRAGTPTMTFYLPPDGAGMLVRGTSEPIGTFAVDRGSPEMVASVGGFFGKTTVIVCQPWQTAQSWLLDGHFIPACPPHGGPADIVYNHPGVRAGR